MARLAGKKSAAGASASAGSTTRKTRGREATPTQNEGKRGRGKSNAAQTTIADLNAIEENVDPQLQNETEHQLAAEMALAVQAAEAASHTVPGDSHSKEEILENLPILYSSAEAILQQLQRSSRDLSANLEPEAPLDSKFRFSHEALLYEVQRLLTAGNDGFLDAGFMKQTLLAGLNVSSIVERALEAIVFRINLALLASKLWLWNADPNRLSAEIGPLDADFPFQFVGTFYGTAEYGSKLIKETLDVAIEIRTQAAIASLRNDEIEDPWSAFKDSSGTAARGFGKGGAVFASEQNDLIARATILSELFKNGTTAEESVQTLEEKYPFHDFFIHALSWVAHRASELRMMIYAAGGIEAAFYSLENPDTSLYNAPQLGGQKETFTQSGFPGFPSSQITHDLGFNSSQLAATETPRKTPKRKADSGSKSDGMTKRQKVQMQNPMDYIDFDRRIAVRIASLSQADNFPPSSFPPTPAAPSLPKEPKIQSRVKWTTQEVNALIEFIEDFGPAWSKIKDLDDGRYLGNRDQVALKDKARNLKFEALKSGRQMYKNFERVTLSESMKAKLNTQTQHPTAALPAPEQHLEETAETALPGIAEYARGGNAAEHGADEEVSQNGEPAFEDAPENPQEDVVVDPNLSK